MPLPLLSFLSRLTAAAMLLQTGAPAIPGLGVGQAHAPERPLAPVSLALATKAMKGVPMMRCVAPVAPPSAPAPVAPRPIGSLLDEVGRAKEPVGEAQRAEWRMAVARGGSHGWARLWLAEADLARQYPQAAAERIDALLRANPRPEVRGLAWRDRAECLFYMGRYGDARRAFEALLRSAEVGYDRRNAAMLLAHARACEAYHAQNERLGIPLPLRLDPLCGAAALATCLRALGMPYDQALVADAVRHTGEGSSLQDVSEGAGRLGLASYGVQATEKGLRNLPLPAVAHVEDDHFVAVVAADASGVEYVCSDCGRWPGGPVRVSWKAWRAMKPGTFLALAKWGSPAQLALERIAPPKAPSGGGRGTVDVAVGVAQGPLPLEASRIATRLVGQVLPLFYLDYFSCGNHPTSDHCPPGAVGPCCPSDSSGPHAMTGPVTGDPVNLVTAEEEYAPPADLQIYNPLGPSVSWGRIFNSLSSYGIGFGNGWSNPYNVGVSMPYAGSGWGASIPANPKGAFCGGRAKIPPYGFVYFPNGATIPITAAGYPSASRPSIDCTVPPGYRLKVTWTYDAATDRDYLTVLFPNRTKWVVGKIGTSDEGQVATFRPIGQLTDAAGNSISFAYATYNVPSNWGSNTPTPRYRLASVLNSAGETMLTLGYDANGYLTSAHDWSGRYVYYHTSNFYVSGQPITVQDRYVELDQVSQVVPAPTGSAPVRTSFGWVNGPVIHIGDVAPYLGSISVPSPTGTGMATAHIAYVVNQGTVASVTDANGFKHEYSAADPDGTADDGATTVKVKDAAGNLVKQFTYGIDSSMGWTYLKNAQGQTVVSRTFGTGGALFKPTSVTDGNGRTWNYTYDGLGNPLTATTPKGTSTTATYDFANFVFGELASVQEGTKTPTGFTYYEPSGFVHSVSSPVPGGSGSGSTQTTTYTYTSRGNVATVTSPGNDATASHVTTYGYLTDGSYSHGYTSDPAWPAREGLGRPITVTDSLGKVTHLGYDPRGNLTWTKDALGNVSQADYNVADQTTAEYAPATGTSGTGSATTLDTYLYLGGPLLQADAKNEAGATVRTVAYAYGPEGETLSRTGSAETATLAYDAAYHTVSVADGNAHATTYAYDASGRVASIAYPGATGATYDRVQFTSYDPVGNLLSRTDGNGQVANYTYGDTDGELTAVAYPGATANNVSVAYDAYDRPTSVTDGTGTETTTYDDLDDATSATRTYTGLAAQTFTYTYYPDGSRHTMANVAGTWTYGHDADGRYASLISPAGTSYATYLDNGWQASRTLPNGVATTYGYNAVGALASLANGTGGGVSSFGSFAYDGVFNLTGLTASVPGASAQGGTTTYGYDAKDRLTGVSSTRAGETGGTFAYDAAGNPTALRGVAQAFDADNRQTSGGGTFAYDGDGSPTTYRGAGQSFDPEARLVSRGSSWGAGYRADGLRAWKSVSGARTCYLYDGGEPVVELDAAGSVSAVSVFAPDGLVARSQGGMWTQYAFDAQGSVAQRLSPAGAVLSSSVYDAYGNETTTGAPTDPFGYNARSGYVLDRETGLYCCQNRYYDPQAGRWVTRDPLGSAGGIDLYGYCAAGPVGGTDPSGLKVWIIEPGGGAVDPRDENEIRRQLKLIGAPGSPLQQMMYDLINDKNPHYITPLPKGDDPGDAYSLDKTVNYDPWHSADIPDKGDDASGPCPWSSFHLPTTVPFPPDVNLAHELGHQDTSHRPGKGDPGWYVVPSGVNGWPAEAGDNVGDVENPYRKWRGYPRRARY